MKIKMLISVVAAFVVVFPSSFVMALTGGGVMNTIIGVNVISNQQDVDVDGTNNIGTTIAGVGNVTVAGSRINSDVSDVNVSSTQVGDNTGILTMNGAHNTVAATVGPGNITITVAGEGINRVESQSRTCSHSHTYGNVSGAGVSGINSRVLNMNVLSNQNDNSSSRVKVSGANNTAAAVRGAVNISTIH